MTALAAAAPNGIDVYFDNVGGDHLDAALAVANIQARFAICGMIDIYNTTEPTKLRYIARIIGARLRVEGFLITQFLPRAAEFYEDVSAMLAAGRLKREETVIDGLEAMPDAFLGLFSGRNSGKMLVRL